MQPSRRTLVLALLLAILAARPAPAQEPSFVATLKGSLGAAGVNVFGAISLAASLDRTGANNDLVVIDQGRGLVLVTLNISGGSAAPTVGTIDLNDLFGPGRVTITSATTFRDAQTGLTDIAVTITTQDTPGSGGVVVLLNDGSGIFADFGALRQFVATDGATNILSGDLNNDDADDLVYIDTKLNAAVSMLNDGANFFLRAQFQETGAFVPVSARLADVNDDDRLDLVVAHQGSLPAGNGQSVITTLLGDGSGRLQPAGPPLQVPDFPLSLVGGVANFATTNLSRIVDFNSDGFPDFAVVTTRGGTDSAGGTTPSVSLLINRSDAPGQFTVLPPIALVDDTALPGPNLQLEGMAGGPHGAMAVADFNADGSPDLVVAGTVPFPSFNRPAAIYLAGNTDGTVRVVPPLRLYPDSPVHAEIESDGTFVGTATGNFLSLNNFVPDVVHVSIGGNIWVDVNVTAIANHAPIVSIARSDLNAPLGQGRKVIITAGETAAVNVSGDDLDADGLTFRLVPTPTGEQPPSFVSINETTGMITINSADINRGPGVARFVIGAEASDGLLVGRDFFTLLVSPNRPPAIAPVADQSMVAGATRTVTLNVSDPDPGATMTTTIGCDRGNFATIDGTTLSLAPVAADAGTTTCTITVRDEFGLSSTASFAVTVAAPNVAPTIAGIADVTMTAGAAPRSITVSASDSADDRLSLSLVSAPAFVSLSDNGNGTGTIRIAPSVTDTTGGLVTVQVRDRAGLTASTSFNVTIVAPESQRPLDAAIAILQLLRDGASQPGDRNKLDNALTRLAAAADARVWLDATHLQPAMGKKAFSDAKDAVGKLGAAAQSAIDLIVQTFRMVALVAIQDAERGLVDPKAIAKAKADLARGDVELQSGRYHNAITEYGNAWARFF